MFELMVIVAVCMFFLMWGFIGRWIASLRGINPVGGFLAGLFLGPLVFLMFVCSPMRKG